MVKLESCLIHTPQQNLRAIALHHHIELPGNAARADIVVAVLDHLGSRHTLSRLLSSCTANEREILLAIRATAGSIEISILQKMFGSDDPDVLARSFWGQPVPEGIGSLRLKGLVFLFSTPEQTAENYAIPDEVLALLNEDVLPVSDLSGSAPPYYSEFCDTNCLKDFLTFICDVDRRKIRPLTDGSLGLRHRKHISDSIAGNNPQIAREEIPEYVCFLHACAVQLGLLKHIGGRLRIARSFETWVRQEPFDQLRDLFDAWKMLPGYDEFLGISTIRVLSGGLRQAPRHVRLIILDMLRSVSPGVWVDLTRLHDHAERNRPRFFRPIHPKRHWSVTIPSSETEPDHPFMLERLLLNHFIQRHLFWLGMIHLGTDAHQHPVSFMLSFTGHSLLCGGTPPERKEAPIPCDQIMVQPDFEILISETAVLSVRYMVSRIGEPAGSGPVDRFRLTRKSIARALEAGVESHEILRFLDASSSVGIPQNVRASIETWINQYGRVRIGSMFYLETKDHFIMKELQSHSSISELVGDPIGLVTNRLDPEKLMPLVDELKRCGYLPKIDPHLNVDLDEPPKTLMLSETQLKVLKRLLATVLQKKPAWLDVRSFEVIEKIVRTNQTLFPGTHTDAISEKEE